MKSNVHFSHLPIMPEEILRLLLIHPDGVYVDGTAGGGGHSLKIGTLLSANGRLICNDLDPEALAACRKRLAGLACRVDLIHGDFASLPQKLNCGLDGVLLDLGVSSYQLDCAERGFSYQQQAPLDMRMDQTAGETAADVINRLEQNELERIFRKYGEERYAARIAAVICRERQYNAITTTLELVDLIKRALPGQALREKQHPAKRVFQAIRIYVNKELDQIRLALDAFLPVLNPGGRIAVLTFHSLEDRIVKTTFARYENPCTCPPEFPVCVCGKHSLGKVIAKGMVPSPEEISANPRARSARLRVFEKAGC